MPGMFDNNDPYGFLKLLEDLSGQQMKKKDFLLKTLQKKWDAKPVKGFNTLGDFIDKIAEYDPTQKGLYMQWIATRMMADPNANKVEDLVRVRETLEDFDGLKSKLENKDVNSYPSFNALLLAVEKVKENPDDIENEAKFNAALAHNKRPDIDIVFQSKEGWVRVPKSRSAAELLGKMTKWCTSRTDDENQYEYYSNKDFLFVIFQTSDNSIWQLHLEDGSYADKNDTMHGIDNVPQWARKPIADYYAANVDLNKLATQPALFAKVAKYDQEIIADAFPVVRNFFDLAKEYDMM